MATRLILDCDTGTDDAIAILAAALHPELELVAVTTVDGNVPLANTTENSLRVLDLIGSRVPVYAGAPRPIVRPGFPVPRHILNAGNPDYQVPYLDLPESVTPVRRENAVGFLIDAYLDDANADTVLVATGPLTNVALALAVEPRLAQRIPKLVIMGGARGWGNVTGVAEFNIWVDPEAAEAVFSAGIKDVVVFPLDATHSAPVTLDDCDRFDAIGSPAARTASGLIRHRILTQLVYPGAEKNSAPIHDALCIAYLVHPEVLTDSISCSLHVETRGELTLGETVMDTRPWSGVAPNATVGLVADADVFVRFLSDAFSS